MKDFLFANVAVIWAETPKSAEGTGEREGKRVEKERRNREEDV